MTSIRAVLFDIDGVLVDSTEANAAFYRALFKTIGRGSKLPDMSTHNHLSVEGMLRRQIPDASEQEIESWKNLAGSIDAGSDLMKPMDGAGKVVPQLAKKYQLGIVTNRLHSGIAKVWDILPFKDSFTAIAAYEDTENHKPYPEPVLLALKKLQVQPAEAIFVGDAKTDLQAGQAAGVPVVILGQEEWPGAFSTISSLSQLPSVLKEINA